uniref:Uncharacterized protein n=1 Tax=Rhizophora mucronata TaxID=61149 RepID=A0A2P2QCI4_RHIMU
MSNEPENGPCGYVLTSPCGYVLTQKHVTDI